MKNIENYKTRFYALMESTMGDVKPLISESTGKGYCLTKYSEGTQEYKKCMFEGATNNNFAGYVNGNTNNKIYKKNHTSSYVWGKPYFFKDSNDSTVSFILTDIFDTGGVPRFTDESVVKDVLKYMVDNGYIDSYNSANPSLTLKNLHNKNKDIATKGSIGEIIVKMPAPPKNAKGVSPITSFTYWPSAHVYYYDTKTPSGYIFNDTGEIDSTFLNLIQKRK